jgi:hypothetical protein
MELARLSAELCGSPAGGRGSRHVRPLVVEARAAAASEHARPRDEVGTTSTC